jgi:hypothetical protein
MILLAGRVASSATLRLKTGGRAMLRKVSERVADCYHRASECRAKANDAFNEAARQEYLDIERRWLMLARSYELSDRVTDYVTEAERRLRVTIPRQSRGLSEDEPLEAAVGVRCANPLKM